MKFKDTKKAIATCDSKYIEQITHNRMYFTKDEKNSACSVDTFIEKMNEFIWNNDMELDKIDIHLSSQGTVTVYADYDEVDNYFSEENDYSDLEGLNEDDIY